MQLALGHWSMAPDAFWAMTFNEYLARLDGYLEKHGLKSKGTRMTRARLDELKRLYPDTPR